MMHVFAYRSVLLIEKTENLLSFKKAGQDRRFRDPNTGKAAHASGIYRKAFKGSKSVRGLIVRLEWIKLSRGFFTSEEAIDRFHAALNDQDQTAPPPRSASRRAQIKAAEQELVGAGFELE